MTAPQPVPGALYAEAWPVYRALGWHGAIPLPDGKKYPPPTDTTGWAAPMPSGADCQAWADEHYRGTTQLALRLPDTVIGVDVDAYGTKVGAATLAEAERRYGPLPAGPWSSARRDGTSGIRFYRVPAGTVLATVLKFDGIADEHGYGCVEIIQHHHRYAVVWPSIHPTGAAYSWRGTAGPGLAPSIDDLPALPTGWVEGLRSTNHRAEHQATRVEANELLRRMPDGECPTMRALVARTVDELRRTGVTRHDAALTGVLRVIRLGEQGHRGALQALGELQRAFVAATADRNTAEQADAEFERMVYGPNGTGLVLSTPTASSDYGCRHGPQTPPMGIRLAAVDGRLVLADSVPTREEPPAPEVGSLNLSSEFWDARPALKHIRDAANAGWGCADAVLAAMLARQASHMSPTDTVDIGLGPGPLNLFAILYGRPSAGKGLSARIAKRTLPKPGHLDGCDYPNHPRWKERPLGSGEGLVESYFGIVEEPQELDEAKTRKVKRQVRRSIMFTVDEGEAFTRKAARNGTTIAQVIRSAWSGETLGEANASADRDRQLDEGDYAIGLTILFQPDTIGPLFDPAEVGGGTPHRFIYAAADDDTLPEEPPETEPSAGPGELKVVRRNAPVVGEDHVTAVHGLWRPAPLAFRLVDDDARREVIRVRWAGRRRSDDVGELDGHRMQMRGRVAAMLAWWDGGRTDIDGEDWTLAGQILDTSDRVRDSAIAVGTRKAQQQRTAEDTRYMLREVRTREAIVEAAKTRVEHEVDTAAAIMTRKVYRVHCSTGEPTGGSKLRESAGRYKQHWKRAAAVAVEAGWLTREAGARKDSFLWSPGPNVREVPNLETDEE